MGVTLDIKTAKKCAFCKYWYDPTHSGITPKAPHIGLWTIPDPKKKCLCKKTNTQMTATNCCNKYACKL